MHDSFWLTLIPALTLCAAAETRVERLTCEGRVDPLAVGRTQPRLSWRLATDRRGARQTAYRLLVASAPDKLAAEQGDLWDSGRVESADTTHIVYAGRPLASGQRCWWAVRVWDETGAASAWSAPATFGAALSDWTAQWLAGPPAEDAEQAPLRQARWIWLEGVNARHQAPAGTVYFRRDLDLPAGELTSARLVITGDDQFVLYVNGAEVARSDGQTDAWRRPVGVDLTPHLKPGRNRLAVEVTNTSASPAGLAAGLVVTLADGGRLRLGTDRAWKATATASDDWRTGDAVNWKPARVIAEMGQEPWGRVTEGGRYLPPASFLRRSFNVTGPLRRATVYASALGVFELHLNGEVVGDDVFAPGWTDYKTRIPYLAYDVTDRLKPGENVLGAILADGWYSGYVGMFGRDFYGDRPLFLAELVIEQADGTTRRVATDDAWQTLVGPITEADLLHGERQDNRLWPTGWDRPGAAGTGWQAAELGEPTKGVLEPYRGAPVRRVEELRPVERTEPRPGVFVFNFAQNMVGRVRLKATGPAGTEIRLRFAEWLNNDGTLYTANYRGARCIDHFVLGGQGEEVWEPRFTFRGFQYVEVTGYPGTPELDDITGVVLHADMPRTGDFRCSSELVNKIYHCNVWGNKGNYLEVPTDCPQRDERLGWTGDAQAYVGTAAYNFDVQAFFEKWLVDLDDAQRADGAYPDVAPWVGCGYGVAGWGDAGVICPWVIYQRYGDRQVLADHYPNMKRWVDYLTAHSRNHIRPAEGYGDWLSVNSNTPKDLIGTAFYAYVTNLLIKSAEVLGETADVAAYTARLAEIKQAFRDKYVGPDGKITAGTQTANLLALGFDLLTPEQRSRAVEALLADLAARDGHLSTGFLGTTQMMGVLAGLGRNDVAYSLLLKETYPSWGFMVRNGATTIWERWDGWTPDKGFQNAGMNSFNHYAFGCVAEWLYGTMAGLAPLAPGFDRVLIRPTPGPGIDEVEATYDSLHGPLRAHWTHRGGTFTLTATLPPNTGGEIHAPTSDPATLRVDGRPVAEVAGVTLKGAAAGRVMLEVVPGSYTVTTALEPAAP